MPVHDIVESDGFARADSCRERHDKLDRVLYDAPEGVFPRLRQVEMFATKVAMAAAFGSFLGGGVMSIVVGVVVYKLTKG